MRVRGDLGINEIRLGLDERLAGRSIPQPEPDPAEDSALDDDDDGERSPSSPPERNTRPKQSESVDPRQPSADPVVSAAPEGETVGAKIGHETKNYDTEMDGSPDSTPTSEDPGMTAQMTTGATGLTDLNSLHARCWTLAARLAQRHGLEGIVAPLSNRGIGYLVTDIPDANLIEGLDDETLGEVSTLWWQLAACSELTVAPPAQILPSLKEGSILKRAIQTPDPDLLYSNVWTQDPGRTGAELWCRLDDRAWQDLLNLMDSYRALHRQARQTNTSFWD